MENETLIDGPAHDWPRSIDCIVTHKPEGMLSNSILYEVGVLFLTTLVP